MCDDFRVHCIHTNTQMEQKRSEIKTRIRQLVNLMPLIFLCLLGHNRLSRVVKEQRSHNRLVEPNRLQLREHGMAEMGIKRITQKKIISIIFYVRQLQSTRKMHREEINASWWWWWFGVQQGAEGISILHSISHSEIGRVAKHERRRRNSKKGR